jgi:hypothetical protein
VSTRKSSLGTTKLALTAEFNHLLGLFFCQFTTLDLTIDWAVGEFLKTSPYETHVLTAGLMFGQKARLLTDLIKASSHTNRDKILAPLARLRGMTRREVFAHSYIWSDNNTVKFVHRTSGQRFEAKEYAFTWIEFNEHVLQVTKDITEFYKVLGVSDDELRAFAEAALSRSSRTNKSPGKPPSKAS